MPGGRHRWEFMLHPGEDPAAFLLPEVAADLAAPLAPCPIEVERQVVYTFHDRTADRWRDGRVFLLGDAAHLMPPFAGQGLSAGVRDAGNLAWKVALAVRGALPDAALDSYEAERRPHAEAIMRLAVGLGSVIQTADPRRARMRDAVGRATQAVPPLAAWLRRLGMKPAATLRAGLLAGGRRRPLDARARSSPNPMVGTRDRAVGCDSTTCSARMGRRRGRRATRAPRSIRPRGGARVRRRALRRRRSPGGRCPAARTVRSGSPTATGRSALVPAPSPGRRGDPSGPVRLRRVPAGRGRDRAVRAELTAARGDASLSAR